MHRPISSRLQVTLDAFEEGPSAFSEIDTVNAFLLLFFFVLFCFVFQA